MEKNKNITLGRIVHVILNLSLPEKFNFNLDINSLNLFIGQNGTGKSFLLKIIWVFATHINNIAGSRQFSMPYVEDKSLQELVNRSIKDNDITGNIRLDYNGGDYIDCDFVGGIIKNYDCNVRKEIISQSQPIYMSKDTRLVTDLTKYLAMKDMVGMKTMSDFAEFEKINKIYPLFDIIFFEKQILTIENLTKDRLDKLNLTIKSFDEKMEDFLDIKLDLLNSDVLFSTSSNPYKSLTTLGAGHQALFTMFLAQP